MFRKLIISLVAGANSVTILLLWLSCLSTFVPPSTFPKVALMGLTFPVFFTINCGFIAIWLLVEWRAMWVPVAGLLPIMSFTLDYYPFNKSTSLCTVDTTNVEGVCPPLRISTFNTAYLSSRDSTEGEWNANLLIDKLNADIICCQETLFDHYITNELFVKKGYKGKGSKMICIYTRYEFIDEPPLISYQDSTTELFACRIRRDCDTLLIINVHMASSCINPDTKTHFSNAIINHNTEIARDNGRIVLSHLAQAMARHQIETDSICSFVRMHEGDKILLCGDFNDTPISYTYQQVSKVLTDSYRESGNGLGWTFNTPGFWGRIDHIFHSTNLNSTNTYVEENFLSSDHFPVVTTIKSK